MSKRVIFTAALALLAAAVFFLRAASHTPAPLPVDPLANLAAPPPPPSLSNRAELSAAAQDVATRCLGFSVGEDLESSILAAMPSYKQNIVWKVVRAEAGGKEFRLRLAMEPAEKGGERLELKIFAVDEEGLPDLVREGAPSQDPEARMQAFLAGKRVISEIISTESKGADGSWFRAEREDGRLVEAEFAAKAGRLACSGKSGLSCKCL